MEYENDEPMVLITAITRTTGSSIYRHKRHISDETRNTAVTTCTTTDMDSPLLKNPKRESSSRGRKTRRSEPIVSPSSAAAKDDLFCSQEDSFVGHDTSSAGVLDHILASSGEEDSRSISSQERLALLLPSCGHTVTQPSCGPTTTQPSTLPRQKRPGFIRQVLARRTARSQFRSIKDKAPLPQVANEVGAPQDIREEESWDTKLDVYTLDPNPHGLGNEEEQEIFVRSLTRLAPLPNYSTVPASKDYDAQNVSASSETPHDLTAEDIISDLRLSSESTDRDFERYLEEHEEGDIAFLANTEENTEGKREQESGTISVPVIRETLHRTGKFRQILSSLRKNKSISSPQKENTEQNPKGAEVPFENEGASMVRKKATLSDASHDTDKIRKNFSGSTENCSMSDATESLIDQDANDDSVSSVGSDGNEISAEQTTLFEGSDGYKISAEPTTLSEGSHGYEIPAEQTIMSSSIIVNDDDSGDYESNGSDNNVPYENELTRINELTRMADFESIFCGEIKLDHVREEGAEQPNVQTRNHQKQECCDRGRKEGLKQTKVPVADRSAKAMQVRNSRKQEGCDHDQEVGIKQPKVQTDNRQKQEGCDRGREEGVKQPKVPVADRSANPMQTHNSQKQEGCDHDHEVGTKQPKVKDRNCQKKDGLRLGSILSHPLLSPTLPRAETQSQQNEDCVRLEHAIKPASASPNYDTENSIQKQDESKTLRYRGLARRTKSCSNLGCDSIFGEDEEVELVCKPLKSPPRWNVLQGMSSPFRNKRSLVTLPVKNKGEAKGLSHPTHSRATLSPSRSSRGRSLPPKRTSMSEKYTGTQGSNAASQSSISKEEMLGKAVRVLTPVNRKRSETNKKEAGVSLKAIPAKNMHLRRWRSKSPSRTRPSFQSVRNQSPSRTRISFKSARTESPVRGRPSQRDSFLGRRSKSVGWDAEKHHIFSYKYQESLDSISDCSDSSDDDSNILLDASCKMVLQMADFVDQGFLFLQNQHKKALQQDRSVVHSPAAAVENISTLMHQFLEPSFDSNGQESIDERPLQTKKRNNRQYHRRWENVEIL